MKFLVFSDSHRNAHGMLRALSRQDCDLVFFLGDGLSDLTDVRLAYPALPIVFVPGNCDPNPDRRPETLLTEEGGKRFFLTHGHSFHVKQQLDLLRAAGVQQQADVILFGHTHQPLLESTGRYYLMNPGSIGKPSYPRRYPTYGEIILEYGRLQCTLREVK